MNSFFSIKEISAKAEGKTPMPLKINSAPAFTPKVTITNAGKPSVLELASITKTFRQGGQTLRILDEISLSIGKGETTALLGPSGAGKSTLLNIAGLLERPDSGTVILGGHNAAHLSDDLRTRMRKNYLGFVYQYHNLLPEFSALENVIIPQMIAGENKKNAKDRAVWLLDMMGLSGRLSHRPSELSGGEQQRTAIARALANCPHLLLADEPTGNLDTTTAETVFELLLNIIAKTGLSALIATHNPTLATRMNKSVTISSGKLIDQEGKPLC